VSDISRVGVIGLGLMGSGIAELCARAGLDVLVVETDDARLDTGLGRVRASLARAVERGKLDAGAAEEARARISGATAVEHVADRELIIEAASEDEELKLRLFARLDAITDASAILASNTSAIPIERLAAATARPQRVVGLHFFNPAPVMQLVEVIPAASTSTEAVERARAFALRLGKTPVRAPDRPGFIVNALLIPYLLAGIRMVERGEASAIDVDTAMRLGCGHPMGPLELADFAGLDTVLAAALSLGIEPPTALERLVAAGDLGRKSGRGFYDHVSRARGAGSLPE
jgi:3-hydroxybutyryl-CoA dehydrogenase